MESLKCVYQNLILCDLCLGGQLQQSDPPANHQEIQARLKSEMAALDLSTQFSYGSTQTRRLRWPLLSSCCTNIDLQFLPKNKRIEGKSSFYKVFTHYSKSSVKVKLEE